MKNNLLILASLVSILALASGCAQDSVSAKSMSAKDLANTVSTLNQGTDGSGSGTDPSSHPANQGVVPVSHQPSAPAAAPAAMPASPVKPPTVVVVPPFNSGVAPAQNPPPPQVAAPTPAATPMQSAPPVQAAAPTPTPTPSAAPSLDLNTGIGLYLNSLYTGLLKRAPDQAGFNYWVAQNAMGVGCKQVAMGFILSSENGVLRNKALMNGFIFSQSDYIAALYRGLLGREPDQAGFSYWYGGVLKNDFTVATVEQAIIGSSEFTHRCSSLGLAQ